MKLLYIAGPYRAKCQLNTQRNVVRAESMGKRVLLNLKDWYPVIPHKNTELWDFDPMLKTVPDELYLKGTLAMMRRCDAVLVTGDSEGTRAEVEHAKEINIPVYTRIEDVCN